MSFYVTGYRWIIKMLNHVLNKNRSLIAFRILYSNLPTHARLCRVKIFIH